MTTRRQFLLAGALGALSPRYTEAQARPPRVGILAPRPKTPETLMASLLERLAELGYREGAGMLLEFRSADGVADRYPRLAHELIDKKCDLLFAFGDLAIAAFRDARTPIPVVFISPDSDPLERGYVESLRRPGRNMTGVYVPAPTLAAKRLEIALEVLPAARRFFVLVDVYSTDQLVALRKAAETRRVELSVVEYEPHRDDLAAAFETARRARIEAMIGFMSPQFFGSRAKLAALIASHRIAAFFPSYMAEQAGILLSYHTDLYWLSRKAAEFGDKILKGAKPADIPVEQPDAIDLVVNLKTAKTLGIKIPYSVLARATKVIE